MKIAYSYTRFSSLGQKDGSSEEGQQKNIEEYAARNGMTLVECIVDRARSASKGHHRSKGNLKRFEEAVSAGLIKSGSHLLIDKLDRLTRQQPITVAQPLIVKILQAGITIHTVMHGTVLRPESVEDQGAMHALLAELFSGYLYTRDLGIRIRRGKAKNEAKAREEGKAVTSLAPYWLKAIPGSKVEAHPDRAAICKRIIKRLEADGDQPFGKSAHWNHMYVLDILRNRAVLGEYTPKLTNPATGESEAQETILDFYPRVIDQLTWDDVQARIAARNRIDTETRRQNTITGGRVGTEVKNLFTHLIECDGYKMSFHQVNDGDRPYLVSRYWKGHKSRRIRYDLFETAFLSYLQDLDWKAISGEGDTKELTSARANLAEIASEIDRSRQQISKWEEIVNNPEAPVDVIISMEKRLNAAKPRQDELAEAKERIAAEIEALRAKAGVIVNPEALLEAIQGRDNLEVRARCRQEILKRVSKIEVSFCEAGDMHGSRPKCPMTQARVFFANGVERQIGIWGDSWIATMQPFPV